MASAWGVTTNAKNIEFTYNWAIEKFDFNIAAVKEMIESPRFTIPGVQGELYLMVEKRGYSFIRDSNDTGTTVMPTNIKIGDRQFNINSLFSVAVKSSIVIDESFIGELEVIKDGADTQLGEILGNNYFKPVVAVQWRNVNSNCGNWSNVHGFYTTGGTSLLKLVVKITVPGKVANIGGTAEAEEMRQNGLLDFEPLLSDPKYSDIVLKCDGMEFLCHKVILVSR